jgi:hypothetical protein
MGLTSFRPSQHRRWDAYVGRVQDGHDRSGVVLYEEPTVVGAVSPRLHRAAAARCPREDDRMPTVKWNAR